MPRFTYTLGQRRYVFDDLKSLLAKASPPKSGDQLAGIAAAGERQQQHGLEDAETAREMGVPGDWITPHLCGKPYLINVAIRGTASPFTQWKLQ